KRTPENRLSILFLFSLLAMVLFLCGCGRNSQSGAVREDEEPAGAAEESRMLEAVFFDVGKGDCILFSNSEGNILVDAGYEETAGEVLRLLKKMGVTSLDAMIITHYDKDHVGGAAAIASSVPVGTFYLPDYVGEEDKCGVLLSLIDREGLSAVRVSSDETISMGDVVFTVDAALVRYDAEEKNDNDASLIVEIHNGEDEWLLPGDIEEEGIGIWLDTHNETYDVLKLPHHGRREDNTVELIESVSPEIAVITDSKEEKATKKVLKKLEKNDAEVYRSSVNGMITITSDGQENYTVTTQR
ncbi:MAG: MBL fold metallo-hydrolase, partial [Eubacteriales bacterium]|nr:MBL fold metallo-hydrolase [Eubacteriales bacterium]